MPRHPTIAKASTKVLFGMFSVIGGLNSSANDSQGLDYFEKNIRPLLSEHCYQCHSAKAEKLKANLYLDSRAGWKSGGDSGPVIVPGKPDQSLLIQAVTHQNSDLKMPPKTRISDDEIEKLRHWITIGAPDPRDGEITHSGSKIDLVKGREFWSFKAPVPHPVPTIKDPAWPANNIDRFILAKLESKNLIPSDDATKVTLLRRVYYDLIGLPPSPEQMNAFLADTTPKAFEKIVDKLLSLPEFGERWGRHWLDVTRFAESSGGGRSLVFPHAWRFRDYVIDSFNKDKPYNTLILEHLAGDLLSHDSIEQRNSQLIGSGYLVLGALNYELQDQALLRMEFVDEQIDAMGRTFLGMTLGCARCHDHKFDPIPATDYYALAGIFQSTESMGLGSAASGVSSVATTMLEGRDSPELRQQRDRLAEVSQKITSLKERLGNTRSNRSLDPEQVPGITIDSTQAKLTGLWKSSTHTKSWVGEDYLHDDNQSKGEKEIAFTTTLPETRDYEVLLSYTSGTGRAKQVPVTIRHANGETTVFVDQTKPTPIHGCFASIGTFPFSADQAASVTISNKGTKNYVIADAVSFVEPDSLATPRKIVTKQRNDSDALKELEKKRNAIAGTIKKLEPLAMSPRESESPGDGHLHIRGQIRNKGPVVPRGFITVATKPGTTPKIPTDSSGRLQLAHWIANANNPLTSRVMANRVWNYLLGEGIVRTPDNFGETGELPSHPELLDYLSLRFVEQGWSVKSLIREITLSRTYQLSSRGNENLDPENRLFSRANRKRLEAECIRDTALLVSGQLDPARGGSTMRNPGQYDLNYKFDTVRRSVYTPWFRNSMIDLFEVFDAPNPNLVIGKRNTSTIPTQALFLMNSPFIREQSSFTAKRLIENSATIGHAYQLILGRPPTATEKATTEAFLSQFGPTEQEEAWTQTCQALFSCLDFRFLD